MRALKRMQLRIIEEAHAQLTSEYFYIGIANDNEELKKLIKLHNKEQTLLHLFEVKANTGMMLHESRKALMDFGETPAGKWIKERMADPSNQKFATAQKWFMAPWLQSTAGVLTLTLPFGYNTIVFALQIVKYGPTEIVILKEGGKALIAGAKMGTQALGRVMEEQNSQDPSLENIAQTYQFS